MFSFTPNIYWVLPYLIECAILCYIFHNLTMREDAAEHVIRANILRVGILITGLMTLYNLVGPFI